MHKKDIARLYVRPVCVSIETDGNDIGSEYGNCVVVNNDGWILSARHVLAPERGRIVSRWFGFAELDIEDPFLGENDACFAKLVNFDPSKVQAFPIFGKPSELKAGKPLYYAGSQLPPGIDLENLPKDSSGYDKYPGIFRILESAYIEKIYNDPPDDQTETLKGRYQITKGIIPNGMSGGALIDNNGHVMGILSGSFSEKNQGLSIDLELLRKGMEALHIEFLST